MRPSSPRCLQLRHGGTRPTLAAVFHFSCAIVGEALPHQDVGKENGRQSLDVKTRDFIGLLERLRKRNVPIRGFPPGGGIVGPAVLQGRRRPRLLRSHERTDGRLSGLRKSKGLASEDSSGTLERCAGYMAARKNKLTATLESGRRLRREGRRVPGRSASGSANNSNCLSNSGRPQCARLVSVELRMAV